VRKAHFSSLEEALEEVVRRAAAGRTASAPVLRVLGRVYDPLEQVAGRIEVRGPGVRGGVDLRGDGSAKAYRGWIRKTPIPPEPGETAARALARALRD
jgi:hypothetical protein